VVCEAALSLIGSCEVSNTQVQGGSYMERVQCAAAGDGRVGDNSATIFLLRVIATRSPGPIERKTLDRLCCASIIVTFLLAHTLNGSSADSRFLPIFNLQILFATLNLHVI